ncbi:thiamine phosphate synthase [soil metagenome]
MPPSCRLHLVVPALPPGDATACLAAACEAGDVASIVVPAGLVTALAPFARSRDVALIVRDDMEMAKDPAADGVEIATPEECREARRRFGTSRIVGARSGSSRHMAMELADAGADYIAFAQDEPSWSDEPIIAWWADLFEIPCIAGDPVEPGEVATLLTQRPDFIRPSEAMWLSADDSRRIIGETMRAIAEGGQ